MSEYEVLSNFAERDQLEQVGVEPHLLSMFERGKKYGLSQVELFELSKHLELNENCKNVVYHADYLRNLKSWPWL